jgi:hypothetical protein
MLPVVILGAVALRPAWGQSTADRKQELEMALEQYGAAKTATQRTTVVEYLQHLDRKVVAGAVVDHIIGARNGTEATVYNELAAMLNPDGCSALLDRLVITDDATAKGKLVVALRHCQGDEAIGALAGCLDDTRPVMFEAHGKEPRRVCDLAYDELFFKLRGDARYGLDPGPRMRGVITEKTPEKTRRELIGKLKEKLKGGAVGSPAPSATPEVAPKPPGTPAATPARTPELRRSGSAGMV